MLEDKLISIITPVYNSEEYIEDCIQSVLSQTYQNWELLLIDDCSSDNSINIIEQYLDDPRIKLFKNKSNLKPALTRNVGINNARGDYITFLDSDDFWSKNRLLNQLTFMLNNKIHMSHGNFYFCDENGKVIKQIITDKKISYKTLLKGNQFRMPTMMLSREIIEGYFFENIRHEDYAFFLECLKRVKYSFSYENSDSYYRIRNSSVSSNKLKSAIWTFKIYYQHQKINILLSIYYFCFYAFNGFLKYRR